MDTNITLIDILLMLVIVLLLSCTDMLLYKPLNHNSFHLGQQPMLHDGLVFSPVLSLTCITKRQTGQENGMENGIENRIEKLNGK